MDAVFQGAETVLSQIEDKIRKIREGQKKGIEKACLIVEGYAKEHMSPESPSAPGEAPAVVTGTLRASIAHQVVEEDEQVVGYVGIPSSVPYAKHLEFGTSRMAARPFLFPALHINRDAIREAIKEELQG